MQNIIEIKNKEGFRKIKALWTIAEAAKKEGKERYAFIHYRATTGNLEATDGRRAMTVRFPKADLYGIDKDMLFELSGSFLKVVEKPCDFPAVPRVIPNIGENSNYQHGFEVKALDLNDKYCPVDYEIAALLGTHRIKINGRYLKDLKAIVNDFDLIAWEEKEPGIRPVVFTTDDKSMELVIMPMNKEHWTEAEVDILKAKNTTAA